MADTDGDGYCDGDEVFTDSSAADTGSIPSWVWRVDKDGDGLSRLDDVRVPPYARPSLEMKEWFDTDFDGVPDGAEVRLGLDPMRDKSTVDANGAPVLDRYAAVYAGHDLDQDLLDDDFERKRGLDPGNRDMDGDEIPDGVELRAGTDPTTSHRIESVDTDGDGLCDYEETFLYHTNPQAVDSDRDGLLDGFEVRAGL
ncbi:MAG: hypothetical protein IT365_26040, partial [Candidatus Hydrogenedentes bacterium]|nr:hypothetical protein [Candidatus Hydrogenedentota bacterium]